MNYFQKNCMPIVNKKMTCNLPICEIVYIVRKNRRADFFTRYEIIYMYCEEPYILSHLDSSFCRVSKNLIVNMDMIRSVNDFYVIFDDGRSLSLNQKWFFKLKSAHSEHLLERGAEKMKYF